MELLALNVLASLGGGVSDAGCLVVFQGMVCVVEKYGFLYATTILTYMTTAAKWASFIAL